MAKRVTLKEVAKAAGVSLASASYAVNRTGSLGEESRSHILRIAEELGYRQNLSARATRTGRTGAIGLILPDLTNPFFPNFAQSVVQRARQHGYGVFVTDTEGDDDLERDAVRILADRGVDGIVWFPIRDVNTAGAMIADIPTVVVDRTIAGLESVQADYSGGGRAAIAHLLELGHRRIGVVCGPMDIACMRDRCDAAVAHISAHGELAFLVENGFSTDLDRSVCQALDQAGASAVFVGADLIALGVMRHVHAGGRRVPDDLSVVGFDDIPWAQMSSPPLTTIEMPIEDMASEAVDALLRRIDGSADLRPQDHPGHRTGRAGVNSCVRDQGQGIRRINRACRAPRKRSSVHLGFPRRSDVVTIEMALLFAATMMSYLLRVIMLRGALDAYGGVSKR